MLALGWFLNLEEVDRMDLAPILANTPRTETIVIGGKGLHAGDGGGTIGFRRRRSHVGHGLQVMQRARVVAGLRHVRPKRHFALDAVLE